MKNLNEIITKYGNPDILIDSWENEFEGYAIWEYDDYILWNNEGLYHSNKKKLKIILIIFSVYFQIAGRMILMFYQQLDL